MGESAAKFRPEIDLDEFERRLRAAAPAPRPSQAENSDPLAELARLLGGDGAAKKEDPFEALFRAQAAIADIHNAPGPVQASHEPYFAEAPNFGAQPPQAPQARQQEPQQARQYAGEQADRYGVATHEAAGQYADEPLPYQEAEPHWEPEAQREAGAYDPHAEGGYDPQTGAAFDPQTGAAWDPHYQQAPAQMAPARRRKTVAYGMAAILLLGVAAIGATLALRGKSGGQEVVTIQADPDPAKVKPAQADNAATTNSQTLFDRKDKDNVAKVVAKQEQPADLGATVKSARVVGAAAGVPTPAAPSPAGAAPSQGGDAAFPPPKKVKTVSVRADGSVIDGADARPQIARTLPTMAAGFPGAASGAPAVNPTPPVRPATPKSTERAVTSTTEAALKAPPRPLAAKPQAVKPAPEVAGETGNFAVQLAGSPVESEARAAANTLSSKYAAALHGRHATFVEAKVGDKTVYRVRVGHLSEEAAKSMCTAIKGQGGNCFIAKN